MVPLLVAHEPSSTVARLAGESISAERFVGEVRALASLLPEGNGWLVNACQDRRRFLAGLAAAMLRDMICVLPHNHVDDTVARLRVRFGDLPCLSDGPIGFEGLRRIDYPLDLEPTVAWPPPAFAASQVAACLFTSGSTGEPSPHMRDWGTVQASAAAAARALGLEGRWHVVATVPSQHSYGFESAIFLPLTCGGAFDCARPFYPADVVAALARGPSPRLLVTTPVHLRALIDSGIEPPPVERVLSATAPLSPDLARQAERFFGAPLWEIYGATESGQTAVRRSLDGDEWTPMPGVTVYVERDRAFARGGHVGAPVELADRLQASPDGRFRLLGRHADMILVAGKRGSRAFLEERLRALPGVVDAAVHVAEDEPGRGARIVAFLIAPGADPASLRAALRAAVEPAFMPRALHLVESLPRDGTGKLTRAALAAMAQELAARGAAPGRG